MFVLAAAAVPSRGNNMKQFFLEMLHGLVHFILPILERIHMPTADKLHDLTAKIAFRKDE